MGGIDVAMGKRRDEAFQAKVMKSFDDLSKRLTFRNAQIYSKMFEMKKETSEKFEEIDKALQTQRNDCEATSNFLEREIESGIAYDDVSSHLLPWFNLTSC